MHHIRRNHVKTLSLFLTGAILMIAGCGTSRRGETETVVARIDGRPITVSQLREELLRRGFEPATAPQDQENRLDALDSLITQAVVRLEAAAFDLSRDHVLHNSMRQTVLQGALAAYMDEEIIPRYKVYNKDIDEYWRDHPEQFTMRQTIVNPQQIMIRKDLKDPGSKELPEKYDGWTAEEIINDLYQQLLAGADFDTLALYFSQDHHSRIRAGDAGWLYADSTQSTPWTDSLFLFPVGQIMPPFFSSVGYYIVRINDRKEAGEVIVPDENMREKIARKILQKRLEGWTNRFADSLLAASHVEIIDSTLTMDGLPPDFPMAVSNETDTIFSDEFKAGLVFFKTPDGTRNLQLSDRRRLLNELHKIRTTWKAMRDLGYLDRPEFAEERKNFILRAAELRIRAAGQDRHYAPSEEEIMEYYQNHVREFMAERPIHVQHIVLDNPDTAWSVKKRLEAGAGFIETALQYYRGDPGMENIVYDLGSIAPEDMPDQFFNAALELPEGEISAPVETEWGYHLIRVVAREEGMPMRQAKQIIVGHLIKQHRAEVYKNWRNTLVAKHLVEIDHETLSRVPILPLTPADTIRITDTNSVTAP